MSLGTADIARLRPGRELAAVAKQLVGIFTDIDETLTHEGKLVPAAYAAIVRARAAGLRVIPVTGRPAGWAEVLANIWPVDAVIAENGAVAVVNGRREYWNDEPTRDQHRARLKAIEAEVLASVPTAKVTDDKWLRLTDLAFDIGEHQHLSDGDIAAIQKIIVRHRAFSTRSSIHLHAFYGDNDKAKMLERVVEQLWQESLSQTRAHYLFVGDSPNDQAAFAYFPNSAGVANVLRYRELLSPPPSFLAEAPGGHGFAELMEHILCERS